MNEWMKELKESVDAELREKEDARKQEREAQQAAEQAVKYCYEQILRDLQSGDVAHFNRTALEGQQASLYLRFPNNIVNEGEFFLDLGNFRLIVKWHPDRGFIKAQLWKFDEQGHREEPDIGSRLFLKSDGASLVLRRGESVTLTDSEEFKQELLALIYKRFVLGQQG